MDVVTWFLQTLLSVSHTHMCSPERTSLRYKDHCEVSKIKNKTFSCRFYSLSSSSVSTCLLVQYTDLWKWAPPDPKSHPVQFQMEHLGNKLWEAEQYCEYILYINSRTLCIKEYFCIKYLWIYNIDDDILIGAKLEGLSYCLIYTDSFCWWKNEHWDAAG